jgi:NAD+ diphosphatase
LILRGTSIQIYFADFERPVSLSLPIVRLLCGSFMTGKRMCAVLMPGIRYTGGAIDRDANRRTDPAYISELSARPDTRVVPVWRDRSLILHADSVVRPPVAAIKNGDVGAAILRQAGQTVFLGLDEGRAVFAAELSHHDEETALALVETGAFTDLRAVGPLLSTDDAVQMAYARGILYWHRQQHYCGVCGHATESRDAGHVRGCANDDCGRTYHPRTDPAVIMLVVAGGGDGQPPRCLLGNNTKMPGGVYSTLAGFVEPGESLEEAVAREVFEEAGVRVTDVTYMGSQPWPFPASIMLGFRATALTTDIAIDPQELTDARWFTADQLRTFGEWADEDAVLRLPRKDSIARSLIETWLADIGA